MSDTTNYFAANQCVTPPIRTNIATAGLMTACNAVIPAPSELEGIFKDGSDYRITEATFLWQWEANANQAEQSNLFKFFMANQVNMRKKINTEGLNEGLMMIRPYVQVRRKGPINNNYWKAENGTLALDSGVADAGGTFWRMDLSSLTGIPLNVGWFNVKEWLFVNGLADDGTAIRWAGEVVFREVVGAVVRVTLAPRNSQSALPAARRANPVKGGATRGAPNVSNFESFCAQPPGLITSTLDPYWIGTTRTTFKEDELYNKWRDLVLSGNKLYSELFDLPTKDYNRQVAEDFAAKHVESLMRNTPLANQTVETLDQLETISTSIDSVGGQRCVGKRANPIGFYEQHVMCERVVDALGTQLNFPALFQALYKMRRTRKASGASAAAQNTFEIAVNSSYLVSCIEGMRRYIEDQWGPNYRWNAETKQSPMGFMYTEFELRWPVGLKIRFITDEYFDDYAAFQHQLAIDFGDARFDNLGRSIWINDWSRIYMGAFGSKRIVNNPGSQLGTAQNLGIFDPCVMETVQETNTLTSFTWTAVVDCVPGNLIIENLSDAVPEHKTNAGGIDYDENS
jgi:hypothetical protein